MYEITDTIHRDICRRFGPIVKYTLTGYFFWNKDTQLFESFNGYLGLHWQASYFLACLDAWLIGATVLDQVNKEELPESDQYFLPDNKKMLVILSGIMIESIIVSSLAGGLLQVRLKDAFPTTLNQLFILDHKFKTVFNSALNRNCQKRKVNNRGEILTKCCCVVTTLIPFIFVISLFHPADPVHNLLEDVFEIKVERGIFIVCFAIIEFWGTFLIIGIALVFIFVVMVYIYLTGYWVTEFMPIFVHTCNGKLNSICVKTLNVGSVDHDVLIWVYRSLQVVNGSLNELVCETPVTFHSTGILVGVVVSAFGLIKFHSLMLDGTVMGLSLFLVLLGLSAVLIILYGFECYFCGKIEDTCKAFRSNVLKVSKMNGVLHKTAKSFQLLKIKSGGSYFNVNRSTFLEWCDQIIVNLVNALVTFK